ncbi:chromatin associated protein [Mycena floridula]|nr:chromatin associated protein [Mycena floridula]
MASTIYNHRALLPVAPQKITESLETIRQEFEGLTNDVSLLRSQRDEYEAKLASQVNELNIIRQALYDLEGQHTKIRGQYEEELAKLRNELHVARQHAQPQVSNATSAMYDFYGRDRDRIGDARDPKRIKIDSRRPDHSPTMPANPTPKMPPTIVNLPSAGPPSANPSSPWRDRPDAMSSPSVTLNPAPGPSSISLGRERDPPTREMVPRDLRDLTPREMALNSSNKPVLRPSSPPDAIILSDIDPQTLPPELKKDGSGDWFCIFNPNLGTTGSGVDTKKKRTLDLSLLWTFPHATVVCCVQFSHDGNYLATGCNKTAQIFDVKTGTKTCILSDESVTGSGDLYIRSVRFSQDGKYLATGAEDKQIRIWEIAKKRIVTTFSGHTQEIYSLDFSPDGRYIVSGSGDKTTRIWSLTPFLNPGPSSGPPPNPSDPQYCKVLTITDSPVPPIQPAVGDTPSLVSDAGVTSVAISPDGKYVASGSLDCLVRIWEVQTGILVDRLRGHRNSVYSVVFTRDGKGIVSGSLDRTMKYWDVSWLYTGSKPKREGEERCLLNFVGHKDYVLSVAVSHDGAWIVSGSKDRGVQFWDAKTGIVQCMLQGHKNSVISINLNPQTNLLATGSGDNLARIWKYTTL